MGRIKEYNRVNRALNTVFLSGKFAGRPLYLTLSKETHDSLVEGLEYTGDDVEDYVAKAVGASLEQASDPFEAHLAVAKKWSRNQRSEPPPFTAILFALSYAASLMTADEDFGGANYYDRLGTAIGYSAKKLRFNGKSTLFFWSQFNAWLIENDYEFGQPTAKQFNSHTYVNYPQSQAVVRAGDRKLFHSLFEKYGFSAGEDLSIDEIRQYVSNWIHTSAANQRLKKAWDKQELRDRLCETVLAELQDWNDQEGSSESGENNTKTRLSLVAALVPQFPRQRIDLRLGRSGEAPKLTRSTVEGTDLEVALVNDVYGSMATLSPNPLSIIEGTLEAGVDLVSSSGLATASWRPRLVIPMVLSPHGPYWTEVSRARVGVKHIILVRKKAGLPKDVEAYLALVSTPEFRLATPTELPGLPSGWVAYIDVFMIKPNVEAEQRNLAPLVPMQDEGSIMLNGGTRMARGIWHSHSPPSVEFLASSAPARLEIWSINREHAEPLLIEKSVGRHVRIDAAKLAALECSELSIRALINGKLASQTSLILRSASRPRPLNRQNQGILTYLNPISAEPILNISVQSELSPRENATCDYAGAEEYDYDRVPPSGDDEEQQPWVFAPAIRRRGFNVSCVGDGAHYWICETPDPDLPRSTPLSMSCRNCGQTVLTRDRGKLKFKDANKAQTLPAERWKPSGPELPTIDHDLILDALCFQGSGKFARLEAILSGFVSEPWQLAALARDYASLGYIDLQLEKGSGRPVVWSVPPPKIVFTSDRSAFLTGFRSLEICRKVQRTIELAGGAAKFERNDFQPGTVRISSLQAIDIQVLFEDIRDPLGREFIVLPSAAGHLSANLRNMDRVGAVFEHISVASGDVEQIFDARSARWEKDFESLRPRAVRLGYAGSTYAFEFADGTAVSGPHQLVKLLAARSANSRLHAYDAEATTFYATLGAEPIGLVSRALVYASGSLPSREDGLLAFKQVPAEVARDVLYFLYQEPIF